MDALKLEIEKKRKAAGSDVKGGKKWVKRGDKKAKEAEDKAAAAHVEVAQKVEVVQQSPQGGELPSPTSKLKPTEVMRRLRGMDEPVTLFGETDDERASRYSKVSSNTHRFEKVDDLDLKEGQMFNEKAIFNEQGDVTVETQKEENKIQDEELDEEEEEDAVQVVTIESVISKFLKKLLREWEAELAARPKAEQNSTAGKTVSAAYQQSRRHIKPLFKALKHRAVPFDILSAISDIVSAMHAREYVKANDAYIKCAIGTQAWPIGITMLNHHERPAHDKIDAGTQAHIMNDETQRKYLQAVKRLMTFCQRAYPADPSKMVS